MVLKLKRMLLLAWHARRKRNEEHFNSLWEDLLVKTVRVWIGRTHPSSQVKTPTCLDGSTYHDDTPRDMQRRPFFEIIDKPTEEIKRSFDSTTFSVFQS